MWNRVERKICTVVEGKVGKGKSDSIPSSDYIMDSTSYTCSFSTDVPDSLQLSINNVSSSLNPISQQSIVTVQGKVYNCCLQKT